MDTTADDLWLGERTDPAEAEIAGLPGAGRCEGAVTL